jgi:spermidine synthase
VAFVERAVANREQYDLILVDSTDPVDAAVDLFTEGFYRNCAALLGETGILVPQSDSPSFYLDRVARIHELLSSIYTHARLYLGQTLSYPGCVWAFTAASQSVDVGAVPVPEARVAALEPELRVFNADVMRACIALPNYIRRRIAGQPGWALPTIADEVGPGTVWRPGTVKEAE